MIHSSAIIDPSANLHPSVTVGPWSIIGPDVVIGEGSTVASHCVIKGPTTIGKRCEVYQFSTIGEATPDLKYQNEPTTLTIGDDNIFREGVTIHRGTVQDRGDTLIGNHNLLMAYVHVGHDCVIGDHCILVNNVALAGHVQMDDWGIIGGYTGVHQYCRLGAHSYVGTMSKISQDVPAYVLADGRPAAPKMINVEGLRRRDFSSQEIKALQKAYKLLYRKKLNLTDALDEMKLLAIDYPCITVLVESIERSTRGIIRP